MGWVILNDSRKNIWSLTEQIYSFFGGFVFFERKKITTLAENTLDKSHLRSSFSASMLSNWGSATASSILTTVTVALTTRVLLMCKWKRIWKQDWSERSLSRISRDLVVITSKQMRWWSWYYLNTTSASLLWTTGLIPSTVSMRCPASVTTSTTFTPPIHLRRSEPFRKPKVSEVSLLEPRRLTDTWRIPIIRGIRKSILGWSLIPNLHRSFEGSLKCTLQVLVSEEYVPPLRRNVSLRRACTSSEKQELRHFIRIWLNLIAGHLVQLDVCSAISSTAETQ